jgi:hypothetical protein
LEARYRTRATALDLAFYCRKPIGVMELPRRFAPPEL